MSYISEKVAYLDGLADGMSLNDDKEGKLLRGIIDALGAIAEELEEQDETLDDINDCIDEIYNELDELDESLFEDDGEEGDDDFFEVVCPACGETIYFDEDMLDSEEGLICPCCNEPIDLDIVNANRSDDKPDDGE